MPNLRILLKAWVIGLLFNAAAFADGGQSPPPGIYSGEGLNVTLKRSADGYTGVATLGDKTFDLRGVFDPAKGLQGTFTSNGAVYTWSAVLEGRTLRFQTGGTEYKLAAPPDDNPLARKPAADNPLARKPEAPAAPRDSTPIPAAQGSLKFTRLSIKDPGINNIEAFSFLVPEGWKTDGGIRWFPDCSVVANLLMTFTDSRTGAQIQFLPLQNFTWLDHPVMPMQPGTNYMGNIVHQPVHDPAQFIRSFYGQQTLPQLAQARQVSTEDLKKVAELVSQAYGGQSQVIALRVRFEYLRDGKPWEEDVYVTLVFTSNSGITIWTVSSAYSFRAPKDELDRLVPLMTTTVQTSHMSQDWYSGYMYVQQLFMNRMNQGIKNAAALSATITKNSEEIRQKFSESYRQHCESQDRISRNFSEYVRGVETYQNPYESRPVQLPSGYRDAWVSASGEYVLSPQAGFDPNVGSTVEWRRMDLAPR